MHYRLRWLYTLILCLMISFTGYYGWLLSEISNLNNLHISERDLKAKIATHQGVKLPKNAVTTHTDFLSQLLLLVQMHGLSTQSVDVQPLMNPTTSAMIVHLGLEGTYTKVQRFIMAIALQNDPIFILDFTCKQDAANNLELQIDILRINNFSASLNLNATVNDIPTVDPFCTPTENVDFNSNLIAKTQNISLLLFKMVGFIQQGTLSQAFISLPSGQILLVNSGMVVGKEQGTITRVLNDHVEVLTADKKLIKLALAD